MDETKKKWEEKIINLKKLQEEMCERFEGFDWDMYKEDEEHLLENKISLLFLPLDDEETIKEHKCDTPPNCICEKEREEKGKGKKKLKDIADEEAIEEHKCDTPPNCTCEKEKEEKGKEKKKLKDIADVEAIEEHKCDTPPNCTCEKEREQKGKEKKKLKDLISKLTKLIIKNGKHEIILKGETCKGTCMSFFFAYGFCKINTDDVFCEPVFRVPKDQTLQSALFIDLECRVYKTWHDFLENNKFPSGLFCYPRNGIYLRDEETEKLLVDVEWSPASSYLKKTLQVVDAAGTGVSSGCVALGVASILSLPVAGPLLAASAVAGTGAAVYGAARALLSLVDRGKHGQSVGLGDPEARMCWLATIGGAVGTVASTATTGRVAAGRSFSTTTRTVVTALSATSMAVGGIGLLHLQEKNTFLSTVEKEELDKILSHVDDRLHKDILKLTNNLYESLNFQEGCLFLKLTNFVIGVFDYLLLCIYDGTRVRIKEILDFLQIPTEEMSKADYALSLLKNLKENCQIVLNIYSHISKLINLIMDDTNIPWHEREKKNINLSEFIPMMHILVQTDESLKMKIISLAVHYFEILGYRKLSTFVKTVYELLTCIDQAVEKIRGSNEHIHKEESCVYLDVMDTMSTDEEVKESLISSFREKIYELDD